MGLSRLALALALALGLFAAPGIAAADEVADCEARAAETLGRESNFRRPFEIIRDELNFDKAETTVGTQFVSSVLHGPARLDTGGEMEPVRFICLHGGENIGALFVWYLPD